MHSPNVYQILPQLQHFSSTVWSMLALTARLQTPTSTTFSKQTILVTLCKYNEIQLT